MSQTNDGVVNEKVKKSGLAVGWCVILGIALGLCVLVMQGCNTVNGLGKDLIQASHGVETENQSQLSRY